MADAGSASALINTSEQTNQGPQDHLKSSVQAGEFDHG